MTRPERTLDLRRRVLEEVRARPSPTRSEHRVRTLTIASSSIVLAAVLFFTSGGATRGVRPLELVALATASALACALVQMRLSAPPPKSMLGRPAPVLLVATAATELLLAGVTVAAEWGFPQAAAADLATSGADLRCALLTALQGGVLLVGLLAARRETDPIHPRITGAALGAAAGAWAVTMAALRCPHAAAGHGLLAHVVPTLVLLVIGAAFGARILDLRGAPPR